MTMLEEVPICPRCGGYIPNNEQPGAYIGALSRYDNSTYVCSNCGTLEALSDHFDGHVPPLDVDLSKRLQVPWDPA